jgi:hypothetical protein
MQADIAPLDGLNMLGPRVAPYCSAAARRRLRAAFFDAGSFQKTVKLPTSAEVLSFSQ